MKIYLLSLVLLIVSTPACDRKTRESGLNSNSENNPAKGSEQSLADILRENNENNYEFISMDKIGIKMSYHEPKVALKIIDSNDLYLFDKKGHLVLKTVDKNSIKVDPLE